MCVCVCVCDDDDDDDDDNDDDEKEKGERDIYRERQTDIYERHYHNFFTCRRPTCLDDRELPCLTLTE